MDIEKELETINELIRLEQPVNTIGRMKKEMYGGQDDIVDVKMQEILDSIQGKRYFYMISTKEKLNFSF